MELFSENNLKIDFESTGKLHREPNTEDFTRFDRGVFLSRALAVRRFPACCPHGARPDGRENNGR
jgi:hypothetical protein